MGQHNVLHRLQQVQFALIELQFYLDMNPDDQRAVQQYNCLSDELHHLKHEYEAACGPLMQFGFSNSPNRWVWTSTPWPWEIEY
ncbi:spore coat protein CotJB [Brevibacillus massiliensis]|jgi:spore coat protein JB|uniref:spore coat protein CotJB n=1 Tax=Brevibacillus massiliensis TaxID=1118054 RepID=UPI00030AC012|nr:spore coat protein CotJB [Brevibacillus massiliensis]